MARSHTPIVKCRMPTPKLYYDPLFKFDQQGVYSNHLRAERDTHPTYAERQLQIAALVKSIRRYGVINPVIVTINAQTPPEAPTTKLHPGQSRCRALRILGIDTVPALIRDRTRSHYKGQEITLEEAQVLFDGPLNKHGLPVINRKSPWRNR